MTAGRRCERDSVLELEIELASEIAYLCSNKRTRKPNEYPSS